MDQTRTRKLPLTTTTFRYILTTQIDLHMIQDTSIFTYLGSNVHKADSKRKISTARLLLIPGRFANGQSLVYSEIYCIFRPKVSHVCWKARVVGVPHVLQPE